MFTINQKNLADFFDNLFVWKESASKEQGDPT